MSLSFVQDKSTGVAFPEQVEMSVGDLKQGHVSIFYLPGQCCSCSTALLIQCFVLGA